MKRSDMCTEMKRVPPGQIAGSGNEEEEKRREEKEECSVQRRTKTTSDASGSNCLILMRGDRQRDAYGSA
jgi:hypothetical protein